MRVLIDECAPSALRHTLARGGHDCRTVQEMGWSGKKNGELLGLAENEFDELITVDTNVRYQQNLIGRKIAIVLLRAPSNRLAHLTLHFDACEQAHWAIKPGDFVEVGKSS
jgi:predicted nuclease of predicted toxin-antitoxin system